MAPRSQPLAAADDDATIAKSMGIRKLIQSGFGKDFEVWDLDLEAELQEYLHEVLEYACDATYIPFSEAGLLLHGSAQLYAKRVEFLYNHATRERDGLSSAKVGARGGRGNKNSGDAGDESHLADYEIAPVVLKVLEDGALNLDEKTLAKSAGARLVPPAPRRAIMDPNPPQIRDVAGVAVSGRDQFQMYTSVMHFSGALMIDWNLGLEYPTLDLSHQARSESAAVAGSAPHEPAGESAEDAQFGEDMMAIDGHSDDDDDNGMEFGGFEPDNPDAMETADTGGEGPLAADAADAANVSGEGRRDTMGGATTDAFGAEEPRSRQRSSQQKEQKDDGLVLLDPFEETPDQVRPLRMGRTYVIPSCLSDIEARHTIGKMQSDPGDESGIQKGHRRKRSKKTPLCSARFDAGAANEYLSLHRNPNKPRKQGRVLPIDHIYPLYEEFKERYDFLERMALASRSSNSKSKGDAAAPAVDAPLLPLDNIAEPLQYNDAPNDGPLDFGGFDGFGDDDNDSIGDADMGLVEHAVVMPAREDLDDSNYLQTQINSYMSQVRIYEEQNTDALSRRIHEWESTIHSSLEAQWQRREPDHAGKVREVLQTAEELVSQQGVEKASAVVPVAGLVASPATWEVCTRFIALLHLLADERLEYRSGEGVMLR